MPHGEEELTKLADVPEVEAEASPDAVVAGVIPVEDVGTEATTVQPVAGVFEDTLYVSADSEFHVEANLTACSFQKLLFPAVTGEDE